MRYKAVKCWVIAVQQAFMISTERQTTEGKALFKQNTVIFQMNKFMLTRRAKVVVEGRTK